MCLRNAHHWAVVLSASALFSLSRIPLSNAAKLTHLLQRERSLLAGLEQIADQVVHEQSELAGLQRDREQIEYELRETNRRIDALQAGSVARHRRLSAGVRSLYKLSHGGQLRLLAEAQSRSDLLLRTSAATRVLQRDVEELRLYRRELARLRSLHASLRTQRERYAVLLLRARRSYERLKTRRAAHDDTLGRVHRDRRSQQRLRHDLSRAQESLLRRIAALRQRVDRSGGLLARKGKLPRPVRGHIRGKFGSAIDSRTGIAIARNGLTFSTARGAKVRCVYAGTVAFSGKMDGFGRLVLLDHGDGYYTLYGFLARVQVRLGANVPRGMTLGHAGIDPLSGRAAAYFELRHHEQAIDPTDWFDH